MSSHPRGCPGEGPLDRTKCRFCGAKAGSDEHIFPQWYSRYINPDKRLLWAKDKRSSPSHTINYTTRWICDPCNRLWLGKTFEDATSPLLKRLMRPITTAQRLPDDPTDGADEIPLSADDLALLKRYAFKMALMGDMMYRPPEQSPTFMSPDLYRHFRATEAVPPRFSLVLGFYGWGPKGRETSPVHMMRSIRIPGSSVPGPGGACITVLMRPFVFQMLRVHVEVPDLGAVLRGPMGADFLPRDFLGSYFAGHAAMEEVFKRHFIHLTPLVEDPTTHGFAPNVWPPPGLTHDQYVRVAELFGQPGDVKKL